jgi:beta-galactosidase
VVQREGEGRSFLFLLNHGAEEATVELAGRYRDLLGDVDCAGVVTLEPFGIAVLKAS